MLDAPISYASAGFRGSSNLKPQVLHQARPAASAWSRRRTWSGASTGGRVLSATPVTKGGERGYNVRVLVDGKRVKQYYVDAEGRMSSR